jgi:hypothetical protein
VPLIGTRRRASSNAGPGAGTPALPTQWSRLAVAFGESVPELEQLELDDSGAILKFVNRYSVIGISDLEEQTSPVVDGFPPVRAALSGLAELRRSAKGALAERRFEYKGRLADDDFPAVMTERARSRSRNHSMRKSRWT